MTLLDPIDIDLLAFIKTGKFDYIKLGQTKEWILNNFPDPDDTSKGDLKSSIWRYGNIEFHFDNNDKLFLIFSDYIDTLDGGPSLRLHKWIFDRPKELSLTNVVRQLAVERISYKLEYVVLPNEYTSIAIYSLGSGVKLSFVQPESDDEDYDQYIDRLKGADSNLFQLSSFSFMTQ
ncbi:hypothetical protein [uncultured Nostoc sp.]|uniref:hypothetical protein n=1 Tax=uncultured Nostoc sp. TaxID=340711 RepID=UPI0035CB87A4